MKRKTLFVLGMLGIVALPAAAQNPAPAPAPQSPPLEVGAVAPDFAMPGATRYGTLAQPVRLSDFRGQAVVLAFYFRSRTRG